MLVTKKLTGNSETMKILFHIFCTFLDVLTKLDKRPANRVLRGWSPATTLVRLQLIIGASVCFNSNDIMAQTAMVAKVQRNSQRGVGTACQSREGSHSQGCHWRKRLESCIEIERDKDRRKRERRNGGLRREGNRGETH